MSKYNARSVEVNGIRFDSIREADRYVELLLLERAGDISDLEVHPSFVLQEGFTHPADGKRYRSIKYTADFGYTENGVYVVEDVKSPPTRKKADYRMRVKMLLKSRPDILFKEVL